MTDGHDWDPPERAEIAADGCPLPPFKWSDDRRAVLRAELDAWYARLYGLTRKQLRYILDPHVLSGRGRADILDPWEDPTAKGPHLLPAEPAEDFPGETFRVLKNKDEAAEYRTRRLVLDTTDCVTGRVPVRTSTELKCGEIYTRADLGEIYEITDMTLYTGIFRPEGHFSIWLFVTEKLTPDRTQYMNKLTGDELEWDGQTLGRKDKQIIEHKADGVELLLFYRKHKSEYSGGGFRYEGVFEYVSHEGSRPTHFKLRRVGH